jgi:hypothetical protein
MKAIGHAKSAETDGAAGVWRDSMIARYLSWMSR